MFVNQLGVEKKDASNPDVVTVDMQQMLYHIIWPLGGDATILFENIKRRLSCYPAGTEKIMVFDRYEDLSAKDHERMQRGGEGSIDFNLTINSITKTRCHSQEQAQQAGAFMCSLHHGHGCRNVC